ncbi:MAG: FxsA family protein [Alphaproteobacteria bacterium]
MINFLSPLTLLPLAELLGFIFIGGSIGFFATLLWLFFAASAGFYLLTMGGSMALSRAAASDDAEVFGGESIFASLCMLIAALLLIFPGFISDFIAVPLLVPSLRQWLFTRTQKSPDHVLRRSYRSWSHMRRTDSAGSPPKTTVIEGEYLRVDDTEKLP